MATISSDRTIVREIVLDYKKINCDSRMIELSYSDLSGMRQGQVRNHQLGQQTEKLLAAIVAKATVFEEIALRKEHDDAKQAQGRK